MLKLLKSSVVLLGVSLIVGCASSTPAKYPYNYWHKEGVSQSDANAIKNVCIQETGSQALAKEIAKRNISYCMKSKGYVLKTGYR